MFPFTMRAESKGQESFNDLIIEALEHEVIPFLKSNRGDKKPIVYK